MYLTQSVPDKPPQSPVAPHGHLPGRWTPESAEADMAEMPKNLNKETSKGNSKLYSYYLPPKPFGISFPVSLIRLSPTTLRQTTKRVFSWDEQPGPPLLRVNGDVSPHYYS